MSQRRRKLTVKRNEVAARGATISGAGAEAGIKASEEVGVEVSIRGVIEVVVAKERRAGVISGSPKRIAAVARKSGGGAPVGAESVARVAGVAAPPPAASVSAQKKGARIVKKGRIKVSIKRSSSRKRRVMRKKKKKIRSESGIMRKFKRGTRTIIRVRTQERMLTSIKRKIKIKIKTRTGIKGLPGTKTKVKTLCNDARSKYTVKASYRRCYGRCVRS